MQRDIKVIYEKLKSPFKKKLVLLRKSFKSKLMLIQENVSYWQE